MTDHWLPKPPQADDLATLVEQMKLGLMSRATGGSMEEPEYRRIRKILLSAPQFQGRLPSFLKSCQNTGDFWNFIREKFETYAERRKFLADEFNPLLEVLETGETSIEPHYERQNRIGGGGFGEVFRFHHRLMKMDFAIKIFSPAFSQGGEGHLERFFREARILFQLHHPNIVRIHDVGMIGRRPFIKMEFLDGKNLNQLLTEQGAVSHQQALWIIERVTDALRHAHEDVRVVHRDLKPNNVIITNDGQLRVIDFGLGVFVEGEILSRITRTGEQIAGGHYTAPELLQNPQLLDYRSDIFSIGALWYTLLTGRPPAGANIEAPLLQLQGVSPMYTKALLRCLYDAERRYTNCRELLNALAQLRS